MRVCPSNVSHCRALYVVSHVSEPTKYSVYLNNVENKNIEQNINYCVKKLCVHKFLLLIWLIVLFLSKESSKP